MKKLWVFSAAATRDNPEWLHRSYATRDAAKRAARAFVGGSPLDRAWLTVGEIQPASGTIRPDCRGYYSSPLGGRVKWYGV